MEEDKEEEQLVYIDRSVQDNKGSISLYLAAVAKEDAEAELKPPGFHLPNLVDLNETEATWKAVAINYSFNLGIPGWDSGEGNLKSNSQAFSRIRRDASVNCGLCVF